MKKYLCEAIGTAVLVLFGCGTAVVTGNIVAISLAFGLSIVAMAYVIGNISGCHVNPAVSLAMLINKKMYKNNPSKYKPINYGQKLELEVDEKIPTNSDIENFYKQNSN